MRIRATVAAVTGALALSAFAVPAAQAATAPDVTFTKVTINNGKPIVAKATGTTSVPVTYTFKHAAGLDISSDKLLVLPFLYVGAVDVDTVRLGGEDPATCTATSSTTASCKSSFAVNTSGDDARLRNTDARTWKVGAVAVDIAGEGDYKAQGDLGTIQVKFHSKLTTDATPEPVRKNATITVKGTLTRANWNTGKYAGYVNAPVTLQFKKKGATTFTTVKTVKAGAAGALKTTVKATVDGTYRFAFAGSSTTAPINAVGDVIDVK
ncbi:hypothetical protein [Streptomyces sp. AK08-02]|uniref:hypothetical protein n=1 Tax=Streptomyces sp. AK08-02 TaxID=3028654 RepID=UPI0029A74244|nr:hypothetical protein [Streptomyces sp. AK08-02]MDX3750888.1 hypothetical protein [Streptomyces sp. AK08-02]